MEEKEISQEDVKKQFEELQSVEQVEAKSESSTEEKEISAPSPEDAKSVTEEVVEETDPKVIPYSRFKEVNDKVRQFEELEKEAGNFIERGPDGKLRLKTQEKKESEDDALKLTEEEQMALDSVQVSVVDKLVNRALALRERQAENNRVYQDQTKTWWEKAQEEFPQVKEKNGDFYKRADKIFREQYVRDLGNGKWTAQPNAHYLSCLQAEKELSREKVKTGQARVEEKKNQKTNIFVEKKSGQVQAKKKVDEKDFENLSPSQQEDELRAQFESRNSDE